MQSNLVKYYVWNLILCNERFKEEQYVTIIPGNAILPIIIYTCLFLNLIFNLMNYYCSTDSMWCFYAGPLLEDHWEERLPSPSMGQIHHSEWWLPDQDLNHLSWRQRTEKSHMLLSMIHSLSSWKSNIACLNYIWNRVTCSSRFIVCLRLNSVQIYEWDACAYLYHIWYLL